MKKLKSFYRYLLTLTLAFIFLLWSILSGFWDILNQSVLKKRELFNQSISRSKWGNLPSHQTMCWSLYRCMQHHISQKVAPNKKVPQSNVTQAAWSFNAQTNSRCGSFRSRTLFKPIQSDKIGPRHVSWSSWINIPQRKAATNMDRHLSNPYLNIQSCL